MDSLPEIDERLRKLLLYVGEEGKEFETRDVEHLYTSVQSIFQKHMKLETEITPLISLITKCIISVPNKQHLYALMTGHLSRTHEDNMNELLNCVLLELQSNMNTFRETNVLNILIYLSELMNLNLLNSFIFISWIQSIVNEIKKVDGGEKVFYLSVVAKVIPYCWKGLDQKVGQEFKKLMDRVQKESIAMPKALGELWVMLYQQYSSKRLKDYSTQERLGSGGDEEKEIKQFNPSFKLSFKDKTGEYLSTQQSKLEFSDEDNLYQQFLKTIEAYLDKKNILTIIETFLTIKSTLYQKLKRYFLVNPNNPYLSKFLIETLWRQVFSRPQKESVIFVSIFIAIASDPDVKSSLMRSIEEVSLAIFKIGEGLSSAETEKFVNVVSLYHANIHDAWQWTPWVQQQSMVNRHVILRLIFQKISLISQFKPTPQTTPFLASKHQPPLLDSQQSMFQSKILQFLNAKAQSQQIITFLNTPSQFTIFFNLLLTRMKNSLTHLTKLTERYRQVFLHFKYDRQTISCIFDFWQHSEYHKIQYFTVFLENGMISFQKLVEGISMKAKLSDAVEKVLLRRVYERVREKVGGGVEEELAKDLEQSLAL